MHPKQHSILHRIGVYCKHFALGFALICTQLTLSSASAQTSEPSEQTIQQATALFEQGVAAEGDDDTFLFLGHDKSPFMCEKVL